MALLLSFDTSGPYCAVAVLRGETVLAHRSEDMAKGQAERLMPLIEEAMDEAGHSLRDLTAIAVGTGPGNFTGIRLSVAAARGLAMSLEVPAIGVTTLEALAHDGPRPMLALVDARRGAVYAQQFDGQASDQPRLVDDPGTLPGSMPRFGTGGDALPPAQPLAIAIGRVAQCRVGQPHARPAPVYIRPADAAPPRDQAPTLLP